MRIKVTFRDPKYAGIHIEGAGIVVNEGFLGVYPDKNKGDCTLYPSDIIEKVEVEEEKEDSDKVVPIRRGN